MLHSSYREKHGLFMVSTRRPRCMKRHTETRTMKQPGAPMYFGTAFSSDTSTLGSANGACTEPLTTWKRVPCQEMCNRHLHTLLAVHIFTKTQRQPSNIHITGPNPLTRAGSTTIQVHLSFWGVPHHLLRLFQCDYIYSAVPKLSC